jgi:hypothetical protein
MGPFEEKMAMGSEGRMTQVNPLSAIPEKVVGAREGCIAAFEEAQRAFGEHIGPEFERALGKAGGADFEVGRDGDAHTLLTRFQDGAVLSLSVDESSITLTLINKEGREDTVTYKDGEISRRRVV